MTKEDKKGQIRLILTIAIVLIITALLIITYKSYTKSLHVNNEPKETYNEVIRTSDEVAPILSENKVEALVEIVPFNYMGNDSTDAYDNKTIKIDSIDDSVLLSQAYNILDKKYVLNYSEDKPLIEDVEKNNLKYINVINLDNIILKDYNTKVSEHKDFIASDNKSIFTFKDDYYISSKVADSINTKLGKIVNSEKKDNSLFIYEKMAILKEQNSIYYLYNQEGNELTHGEKSMTINYFSNHLGEFPVYKHTFNKQDNGYYWYSTEIVK